MSTALDDSRTALFAPAEIAGTVAEPRTPLTIVGRAADGLRGIALGDPPPGTTEHGRIPGIYPEWLGDRSFCATHGVRYPYVAGEMANGIATTAMVIEMARAEMLGFFGAGGLVPERVEKAVAEMAAAIPQDRAWGVNLIHSPNEPAIEEGVADVLVRHGVRHVSVSAFMAVTPAVVRCSATGLRQDSAGRVVRRTRVFAKISRPETAEAFLSPAPPEILTALVERGQLTPDEAVLAARVPVAEDVTVESDSGGHTDNRPLAALLPTIASLRDELTARYGYTCPVRVGAAGGLGTPQAVAAAFALGAAYVVTGSVNQTAVEAGVCDEAKRMLAQAGLADVIMAPAADMFELGVKVQVLRKGSMFAVRGLKLYEIYRAYDSLEAIPAAELAPLERDVFKASVVEAWAATERFWADRDPGELRRAATDPKHRMALLFRSYLGQSSRWAITGDEERRLDYQLWCGPALGSFNTWVRGSFLAEPERRTVVQIARNLMEGAAAVTRAQQLRSFGLAVPDSAFAFVPRPLA